MKRGFRFVIFGALILLGFLANAQLIIEKSVTHLQVKKFIEEIPEVEQDVYLAEYGAIFINQNGKIDKPGFTNAASPWNAEFAWRFKSTDIFYSTIKAFRTDLIPPKFCKLSKINQDNILRNLDDECLQAIENYTQCHLFIFGLKHQLRNVLPLVIPQADFIIGKTGCFDVHAMAPAQVVKDGMLIVIGYSDSRWVCQSSGPICASDSPAAYPSPYYKTTLLVRFDKDSTGKLLLHQDDSCLGRLNKYATIRAARSALNKSGCK